MRDSLGDGKPKVYDPLIFSKNHTEKVKKSQNMLATY